MKQRKVFSNILHTIKEMSQSTMREPSLSMRNMASAPKYISASRAVLILLFDIVYLNSFVSHITSGPWGVPTKVKRTLQIVPNSPWHRLDECGSDYACGTKEGSTDCNINFDVSVEGSLSS